MRLAAGAVLVLAGALATAAGGCLFPESWRGQWFQSGVQHPVQVNATTIDSKGWCLDADGDKYLFQDGDRNFLCYRCVVIHEKHPNVLQYKESLCEEQAPLDTLCSTIPGDALLYSMFRLGAEPVVCPFKGPFTFTYNRGYGDCGNPVSRVDSCTQESRLLLRYQACPDVTRSESTVEELVCLASWKEGSTRYLLGHLEHQLASTDEDRYRCFVWERARTEAGPGFLLAQSGDATCNGVSSATEGSRTMRLAKVEHHPSKCRYPWWLSAHHHWHSLDGRLSVTLNHRNTTLRISNDSSPSTGVGGGEIRVVCHMRLDHLNGGEPLGPDGGEQAFFGGGPRSHAHSSSGTSSGAVAAGAATSGGATPTTGGAASAASNGAEMQMTIVAHLTKGCDSGYVCMRFYRRDSYVVEVQKGSPARVAEEACQAAHFSSRHLPFTTLIAASPQTRRCPFLGRYTVTGMVREGRRASRDSCEGGDGGAEASPAVSDGQGSGVDAGGKAEGALGVGQLAVGCSAHDTMEFQAGCGAGGGGEGAGGGSLGLGSGGEAASGATAATGAFACHGTWTEGSTRFLIASPLSRSSTGARRLCFAAAQVGRGGLHFASMAGACLRPPPPPSPPSFAASSQHGAGGPLSGSLHSTAGVPWGGAGGSAATGLFAFNLTVDGQCSEDGSSAAASRFEACGSHWCLLLALVQMMVLVPRGR